jgi:hypothetical protein
LRCCLQAVLTARAFIARAMLAMLLLLVITTSALPPGALAAALNCPMPCCKGINVMAGCPGGVCHTHFAKQAAQPVESDPICAAIAIVSTTKDGATPAHHAAPKSTHAHVHTTHKIEHNSPQPVSERNTLAQGTESVGPRMAQPCATDCCGAPQSSSAQLRRTRDSATAAHAFSLRAPTLLLARHTPARHVVAAADLRRYCSPRAPPFILSGQSA